MIKYFRLKKIKKIYQEMEGNELFCCQKDLDFVKTFYEKYHANLSKDKKLNSWIINLYYKDIEKTILPKHKLLTTLIWLHDEMNQSKIDDFYYRAYVGDVIESIKASLIQH